MSILARARHATGLAQSSGRVRSRGGAPPLRPSHQDLPGACAAALRVRRADLATCAGLGRTFCLRGTAPHSPRYAQGPLAGRSRVVVRAQGEEQGGGWFKIPFWPWGGGKEEKEEKGGGEEDYELPAIVLTKEEPSIPPEELEVVVVGAGLAGLRAALALQQAGIPFALLEASDDVGGRVRTDEVDGFLLDRGFQIFLTAYPEAKAVLDYEALDLMPFYAGALVRLEDGSFSRVADPFRHPIDGVASLTNPVGSFFDKLRVGLLRLKTVTKSAENVFTDSEVSIRERLEELSFSSSMIDRFFRPFLGGIFFDRELATTSRMLEYVIRMLALGDNTLPAQGIGALAQVLASQLDEGSIRLQTAVKQIKPAGEGSTTKVEITLANGKRILARQGAIVAVDQPAAEALLGKALAEAPSAKGTPRSTVCLYFDAPAAPSSEPILYLNGTDEGIINNLCFPNTVAPAYAPEGRTLVSVSLVGQHKDRTDAELERVVRAELEAWFPESNVRGWRHLRTYRIPFAQPDQRPPTNLQRSASLRGKVFVCGDHRASATFDGALQSGRLAAEALIAEAQASEPANGAAPAGKAESAEGAATAAEIMAR